MNGLQMDVIREACPLQIERTILVIDQAHSFGVGRIGPIGA